MANKKISQLDNKASLGLSDLLAVGDPSTGYLYKTTINDLKTLTGAGVISFNGRIGAIVPTEGDYTLTQLGDVIVTTPASGHILKYNGSNWVNVAMYTGTSAQYVDGTGAYQTFPTMLSSDRLITEVRNQSGSTITKGSVIYLSGSSGTLPLILKAQANAEATSSGTYGVVQNDISNNSTGYVVVIGILTSLDTSAYNAGDILWLSPTVAGGYTTTKPSAPNNAVYVGIVTRSHATQGTIEVKIQNGYELEELHNVSISSVANNDFLVYESATSLWKNKTLSTVLGFTPISLSSLSASAPLSYNNSTGAFSISQASGSTNGYLSSTDWNTFNNKQSALGYTAADDSLVVHKAGTETITGNKTFSGDLITANGYGVTIDGGTTYGAMINFKSTYGNVTARGYGYSSIGAIDTTKFLFYCPIDVPTNSKRFYFELSGLTTNVVRTYTMPDASGTIALTSDIPSLTNFVTLDTTQTITATKYFSAQQYFQTYPIITQSGIALDTRLSGTAASNHTTLCGNTNGLQINLQGGAYNNLNFADTANGHTYTFPAASGTIALTSDIPSLSGYVPTSRTITINGTAYDLSANRSWTLTTSDISEGSNLYYTDARSRSAVSAGTGISYNSTTGVISSSITQYTDALARTAISLTTTGSSGASTYNSTTGVLNIPTYTLAGLGGQSALSGTGFVKISGTTISYDNSTYLTGISSLQVTTALGYTPYNSTNPSGYTSNTGTVTSVSGTGTVSGLTLTGTVTTSGSLTLGGTLSLTSGQVTGALGYTPYNSTNPSGYITGINSTMVTNALGYTPYNSSNPSGYITSSGSITGSAGSVEWGNITSRPGWMANTSLIGSHSNANDWRNSGFYENEGGGSNWPSLTWYNSINVRHSNQGNYHGFQVAMSYYDNLLWFRSYQGSGTFQSWAYAISSQNIGSQSVNYASSAGYASNSGNANNISNAVGGGYTWTGINYFRSNKGANVYMGATNTAPLQAYSDDSGTAMMSFHRGGYYAVNMGLDPDNVFRIGGWSASANRLQMDMSGNLTMAGDITAFSDERVKENIKTIDNALDKVLALRGVSYTRKDSDDKKTKIGVIAQETLPIVPEVVNEDNDGMYSVAYGNFGGLFIEAFKEQQKKIEAQDKVIEELKKLIYANTK